MNSSNVKLRDCICTGTSKYIIYATDVLTQPKREQFLQNKSKAHLRCSRALAIAEDNDIVVLSGPLDEHYYKWLRSLGMSSEDVISYNLDDTEQSLPEIILEDPTPVQERIASKSGTPIFLPFYGSKTDTTCAELLGAEYFGCEESVTLKYFDKLSFKKECHELGIPIVEGSAHEVNTSSPLDYHELAEMVSRLLSNYGKVIIRGTDGSAGRSLFTADSPDIQELYEKIIENRERVVLVEPLLNVISSPNDQWVIDQEGNIHHIEITAQLFQGLKHAGNISGQYYSKRIRNFIQETSFKIVNQMAEHGYRGILGIDYIVSEDGIFPIENNARMNGSSFAHAIMDRVENEIEGVHCWKFYKAQTDPCDFQALQEKIDKVIYDGKRLNSVFPTDCDELSTTGRFTPLLLAEDMYHIDYLHDALSYVGIVRV